MLVQRVDPSSRRVDFQLRSRLLLVEPLRRIEIPLGDLQVEPRLGKLIIDLGAFGSGAAQLERPLQCAGRRDLRLRRRELGFRSAGVQFH